MKASYKFQSKKYLENKKDIKECKNINERISQYKNEYYNLRDFRAELLVNVTKFISGKNISSGHNLIYHTIKNFYIKAKRVIEMSEPKKDKLLVLSSTSKHAIFDINKICDNLEYSVTKENSDIRTLIESIRNKNVKNDDLIPDEEKLSKNQKKKLEKQTKNNNNESNKLNYLNNTVLDLNKINYIKGINFNNHLYKDEYYNTSNLNVSNNKQIKKAIVVNSGTKLALFASKDKFVKVLCLMTIKANESKISCVAEVKNIEELTTNLLAISTITPTLLIASLINSSIIKNISIGADNTFVSRSMMSLDKETILFGNQLGFLNVINTVSGDYVTNKDSFNAYTNKNIESVDEKKEDNKENNDSKEDLNKRFINNKTKKLVKKEDDSTTKVKKENISIILKKNDNLYLAFKDGMIGIISTNIEELKSKALDNNKNFNMLNSSNNEKISNIVSEVESSSNNNNRLVNATPFTTGTIKFVGLNYFSYHKTAILNLIYLKTDKVHEDRNTLYRNEIFASSCKDGLVCVWTKQKLLYSLHNSITPVTGLLYLNKYNVIITICKEDLKLYNESTQELIYSVSKKVIEGNSADLFNTILY